MPENKQKINLTQHIVGVDGVQRSFQCSVLLNSFDQVDYKYNEDGTMSVDVVSKQEPLVCIKEELKNEPIIRVPEIISLIDDEQKYYVPATPLNEGALQGQEPVSGELTDDDEQKVEVPATPLIEGALQGQEPVSGELTNDDDSIVSDHTEVDESPQFLSRQHKRAKLTVETKDACKYDMNEGATTTPVARLPADIMTEAVKRMAVLTPDQRTLLKESLRLYDMQKELQQLQNQQLQENPFKEPEFDMDGNMTVFTGWKDKELMLER